MSAARRPAPARSGDSVPAWARWLLAGCGLGWIPAAPGTWGSLGTVVALGLAVPYPGLAWGLVIGFVLVGSATCLLWSGRIQDEAGRGDPGWIVADEVAGQALATAAVFPFVLGQPVQAALLPLAISFGAFRLFDIVKPGPVKWAELRGGGLGVLLDDIVAGVLAAGVAAAASFAYLT